MAKTSRKSAAKRKTSTKSTATARRSAPARRSARNAPSFAPSASGFSMPSFASAESFFEPFRQIQNSMRDMFSNGFKPFGFESLMREFEPFKAFSTFQPAVNVTEDKDSYTLVACVPEINPDNVEVCVGDNCVTISSRSESQETARSKGTSYSTWSARSFYRSIPLPEVANTAKAEADFSNGVLTISVPKRSSAADKGRKVPIGRKSA